MEIVIWHEEPAGADAAEIETRVKALCAADPKAGGYQVQTRDGATRWRLLPLDRADRPRCGAACKGTGRPCRAPVAVKPNGDLAAKCRRHGGLSTGPQTSEGRAAIATANRARKGTRYKLQGLPKARVLADAAALRAQAPETAPTVPTAPDFAAQLREMAQRELERRARSGQT